MGWFVLGNQRGFEHDDGFSYGFFHTYEAFNVDGRPRKIHVLLPREYRESQAQTHYYPVIYFNDGQTTFWPDPVFQKSWNIAGTLSQLAAKGKIQNVIVVAIYSLNRDKEYTYEAWDILRDSGDLSKYARYVAENVKNFIDEQYRTLPSPHHTAIVGADIGGLAAFYIGTAFCRRFGIVGAFSPSLWAGIDDLYNLFPIVTTLRTSKLLQFVASVLRDRHRRPRIWIDWGLNRKGGHHNAVIEEVCTIRAKEMVEILKTDFGYEFNKELWTMEDPIGGHDELAWGYRFSHFMLALFGQTTPNGLKTD